MVRAIARQAEAERERRAKVIHADGELHASKKLLEAANFRSSTTGITIALFTNLIEYCRRKKFDDCVPYSSRVFTSIQKK